MSQAYLIGALHDGTIRRRTIRICQREYDYVLLIKRLVEDLGWRAWTYREGKDRNLYVAEFSRAVLQGSAIRSRTERIDYARGYFDAEGGVPADRASPPYLYFAQRDLKDLGELRRILVDFGIRCGRLHNPSRTVAPNYWRFYVSRSSIPRFGRMIGSWHPRKSRILKRMLDRRIGMLD